SRIIYHKGKSGAYRSKYHFKGLYACDRKNERHFYKKCHIPPYQYPCIVILLTLLVTLSLKNEFRSLSYSVISIIIQLDLHHARHAVSAHSSHICSAGCIVFLWNIRNNCFCCKEHCCYGCCML